MWEDEKTVRIFKMRCKRLVVLVISLMIVLMLPVNVTAGTRKGQSVQVSKKLILIVGKKTQLKLKGTAAVRWRSSNRKVAVVSSTGVVRGKRPGEVQIKAKGADGRKYVYMVKVVVPHRSPGNNRTYMIAHRGDTRVAPENTMAALKRAVRNGYKSVEADVQFTKDGVPVILHDSIIDNVSNGSGLISEMTYEEVLKYDFGSWKSSKYKGEKILSFQDFIFFCKKNFMHPYIELKSDSYITREQAKKLYNMVCGAGIKNKTSWFSFNYEYMTWIREFDPTADIGIILHGDTEITGSLLEEISQLKTGSNTVFVIDYAKKFSKKIIKKCKELKIQPVARDIKKIKKLYTLNPYFRAVIGH